MFMFPQKWLIMIWSMTYGLNKATYLEQQKLYMRHWEDMLNNRAKLYALIWQYLSQESIAEVKRHQDFEVIQANRDVQRLWKIIEETHKVFTISHIAAIIKKTTTHKEYKLMHQGPYESIITYKERFDIALKAYQDQENADLDEPDVVMDFLMAWIMQYMLISKNQSLMG